MVTMNSDKAQAKRRPDPSNEGCAGSSTDSTLGAPHPFTAPEESPNHLLYKKVTIDIQTYINKNIGLINCLIVVDGKDC